eukprot:9284090-Pyramimonas_sp.AAC.1
MVNALDNYLRQGPGVARVWIVTHAVKAHQVLNGPLSVKALCKAFRALRMARVSASAPGA